MAQTLDDLARLSGVSRATVSRVLNGGQVADETRRRVLEVIEETNYRPNLAARGLASGRTGVVGVVMHVDPPLLFEDPYFAPLLHGLADALADAASGMMMWMGNRSKQETLDQILGIGLLDGVVVTADTQEDLLVDGLLASSLPTVLIGHRRDDAAASYVDVDHIAAARAVTEHLIALGRERVGHITGRRGAVAAEDRLVSYSDAMERAGLETEGLIVEGAFDEASGREAAVALLDAGADAIFAANDSSAAGVLMTLRERGVRVPDDVAVAGFDDLQFAAELEPPLTTVRQGVQQHGFEAARVLRSLIDDPDTGPRRVLLPTELVIRASTVGKAQP